VETDEALDNIAHALAAKHDRVFVVGWAGKGLVRAYHVHDGKLLWEDGSEGTFTTWRTVDTDGKRVFVGGQASPTEGLLSSVVLRALDARTGEQIWENRWNETSILAGAKALARQGWRIVLVGTVLDEEGKWNFTVRVYHAATGRLLWEQMHDDTGNDDNDTDFARAVAMHGDRLFAAGTLGDDFAVLGYDIRSGAFLWENRYDSGFIGAASDICVRDGQVYAAGFTDLFLNQTYLVRVLDTYNGSMLWEDRAEGIGNEHASAIEAIGRLVYVSGTTHSVSTGRDFTVRAYRQERTIHPTDRQ
jgi:outer membrane protein assembly factor BamB